MRFQTQLQITKPFNRRRFWYRNSINQQNGNEKDKISAISLGRRLSNVAGILHFIDHAQHYAVS